MFDAKDNFHLITDFSLDSESTEHAVLKTRRMGQNTPPFETISIFMSKPWNLNIFCEGCPRNQPGRGPGRLKMRVNSVPCIGIDCATNHNGPCLVGGRGENHFVLGLGWAFYGADSQ